MTRIITLLIMLLSLGACTTTQPLYNAHKVALPNSLSQEQAREAIVSGLQYKRWKIREVTDSKVVAEIYVRSHFAKIEIEFTPKAFSIRYLDSENLDYKPDTPKIHRNYNKWIKLLETEIYNYALN